MPTVLPRSFATFAAVLALVSPACSRQKTVRDADPPVTVGALLTTFDVFAPGAVSGYRPRTLVRLGIAKATSHDAIVPLSGFTVRVAWETRDDLVFARRYLTSWRVTVDALASGASCVVRRTHPDVPSPTNGSVDSLRITLSVDYDCHDGRDGYGGIVIGDLKEEGFTPVGLASGVLKPLPDADPPALRTVHFAPNSPLLDAAATAVLDEHARVLNADAPLGLCLAYRTHVAHALEAKREEAVTKYLLDHGIARARVSQAQGFGQAPPAEDDIELHPFEGACWAPKPTTKRR